MEKSHSVTCIGRTYEVRVKRLQKGNSRKPVQEAVKKTETAKSMEGI